MIRKPAVIAVRAALCLSFVGLLMSATVHLASASSVIYVKFNATGANNGTSWTNAYKSLQTALSHASSGQQIWVAGGTYKPGSVRASTFALKDSVALYGGFAGTETLLSQRKPGLHPTVLSGEIGGGASSDNTYHVVTATNVQFKAILDGFTIAGGYAWGPASLMGGGLDNQSSNATLRNLIFAGNSAAYGGGMENDGGSPTLINVTFTANTAGQGGGMFIGSGAPIMSNVTFSGNGSNGNGGGLYTENSSPTLTNATFSGNHAGSGIGNGLYNGGVAAYPRIDDSIFWGDGSPEISFATWETPTITYSILEGGCPTGAVCVANRYTNPQLGPLQNNGGFGLTMALGAFSAAIDTGDNSTCTPADQRGVTRPQGGKCDMGAYEVKALTFKSAGANDGWVLESGENTSVGGSMDSTSTTIRLGDDASNRQYRGLLSFDSSSLPDAATIVLARVKVERQGLAGTDPFTTHGTLTLDLKKPFFGAALGLELGDFQAAATKSPAGSIGSTLVSGWYGGLLNATSLGSVNKTGTTQLRLRFTLDDNNDHNADYLSLFSGNAPASSRPVLIVYYNP
jgi:predicted outer membrane repeat protein